MSRNKTSPAADSVREKYNPRSASAAETTARNIALEKAAGEVWNTTLAHLQAFVDSQGYQMEAICWSPEVAAQLQNVDRVRVDIEHEWHDEKTGALLRGRDEVDLPIRARDYRGLIIEEALYLRGAMLLTPPESAPVVGAELRPVPPPQVGPNRGINPMELEQEFD